MFHLLITYLFTFLYYFRGSRDKIHILFKLTSCENIDLGELLIKLVIEIFL